MTTREQLTQERLDALIDTLVSTGALSPETADELERTRELGDGRKLAKAARDGDTPGIDITLDEIKNGGN